jgi:CheY-like chemotaxis protein
MKAMILEDDPVIRTLLGKVLSLDGYEVDSYSNPANCPLFADESCPCSQKGACPDLIISDYDMPTASGLDFSEHLKRKQCKCKNIAVISGGWDEDELQSVLPSGLSAFAKPFSKRFWAWLRKVKGQGQEMNRAYRRSFERFVCELPLELYFSSPGLVETVHAVARNISKGGMLIECPTFLPPKTSCQLSFKVPDWMPFKVGADRMVMLTAQACHADKNSGTYGLQFLDQVA